MLKPFYVCYFITLGVSVPFFPAYLRQLGLSGQQVSALLAIAPILQLGVPLGWGWLADRTRRPDVIVRGLCLLAFLASLPVIFVRSMPALFGIYFVQQLFAVSILSLADSLAVERTRTGGHYGNIRAYGSASFVLTCLLAGCWLDQRGARGGDALAPALISAGYGLSFLAAWGLRGHGEGERPHARDLRLLFGDRRFLFLLLLAGLHWTALVPYHGFFGILMQDRGLPAIITSNAFIVGSTCEIAVLLVFARLRARFALTHILALSFAATAVRWWLTAEVTAAPLLVALQILHALTFGAFWAAAMAWIAECVPAKLRATGQVVFTTVIGVGSAGGLLLAGALYDATGGATTAFRMAGLLELVPLALVLFALRGKPQARTASAASSPAPEA
jgi:MFS transporter, PPP family, 3-phenylpropionic acid transporter